jgi:hypothetical protein
MNQHVLCRVLRNIGRVDIGNATGTELKEGDIYLLRYEAIRASLEAGDVTLM